MHSDGRFRSQFTMPCDTSTRPLRAPCHRWSNRALWPASSLGRGPFRIPSRSTAASCSSIPWNLRSRCGGLVPQSSATALYRNRATRTQSAATTLRAACRCVVVRNPISECYTLLLRRVPRPVPAMRAYLGGLHALLFLHPLILHTPLRICYTHSWPSSITAGRRTGTRASSTCAPWSPIMPHVRWWRRRRGMR